jgi:hypothetical protein
MVPSPIHFSRYVFRCQYPDGYLLDEPGRLLDLDHAFAGGGFDLLDLIGYTAGEVEQ